MKKFFFDLHFFERSALDPEGSELPDLEWAKKEARQIILELAIDDLQEQRAFDLDRVVICDRSRKPLAEVLARDVLTDLIPPYLFVCSNPQSLHR